MRMKLAFLVAAVAAMPSLSMAQQQGGIINVATIGEPPTLDPMTSTADLVGMITQHIFETLYTFDENWNVTPLLAEGLPDVSVDGKTYTIKLRSGITFHDGSEMTSEDVVASLNRWTKLASRGKQAAGFIVSIAASDPSTVVIRLKEPYAPLLALLAFNNSAAVILPFEKQADTLADFVGTGPYMLKERKADQYIQLVRFADYKALSGDSDGYGGNRHQYLDEIRFVPVPDPNTRVEAAVSGQYDYVNSIPVESFDKIKNSETSEPIMLKPFGFPVFVFNTKEGLSSNLTIRKAVEKALSMEDMLAAAFGSKDFYTADGAFYPASYGWHSEVGTEGNYNLGDPEGAATDLKAAGYKGEPLRILTSRQYEFHYKMAQVAAEYLKLAGFNVDMQVVDWATLTQRRADPKLWDVYITHSPFLPEPALMGVLSTSSPGWWDTPARKAAVDPFTSEADLAKRIELWASVQKTIYDELPLLKIGDFNAVSTKSKALEGVEAAPWPYFWNASIKK